MTKGIKGKVRQLSPRRDGSTLIRLADPTAIDPGDSIPEGAPKDNAFYLREKDGSNYNALYSLALVAATNRYVLLIHTVEDLSANASGTIDYMDVLWE